jgi:putative transposase
MPRRLRIEFEGAIYHVMARANARQRIVRDEAPRQRLIEGLKQAVVRCGWELRCYVVMGNHLHLLVKTPHPKLGAGMQSFLSGYAMIWSGRRWRRTGHLFQGRYRAEMIEDESHYWTGSSPVPSLRRHPSQRRGSSRV